VFLCLRRWLTPALSLIAATALPAAAHDLSHSQSDISVRGGEVQVRLQLDLVGFGGLQWQRRDQVTQDEIDERIEAVYALVREHLRVESPGATQVSASMSRYHLTDNHVLDAQIVQRFDRDVHELVVRSTLDRVTTADHQHLTRVAFGGPLTETMLTAAIPVWHFSGDRSAWRRASAGVAAGVRASVAPGPLLILALLAGTGAPARRSLAIALFALAAGLLCGAALAASEMATLSIAWMGALSAVAAVTLAAVNLAQGRASDRALLVGVLGLVNLLVSAAALRRQGIISGGAVTLAAYGTGVLVTAVSMTLVAFVLTQTSPVGRYLRPAVAVIAIAMSLYWLGEPWITTRT
jgi:hypothetical protein